ncbi:MAG: beta-ketoacyl-[acyl-carrier-protein] synthase family protein [Verrucomicrobiota bacterium]
MVYNKNRVVVTGLGVLAPNGIGINPFWRTLIEGKSSIGTVTHFDASKLKSRIAGEIKNFKPEDYIPKKSKPHRLARHTQLAIAASLLAIKDATLTSELLAEFAPILVLTGVSTSALDLLYRSASTMEKHGYSHATPYVVSGTPPQAIASSISDLINVRCQSVTVSTACAAGLDAIGQAYQEIKSGKAEIAVTGGADAPISPVPFANLAAAGMASSQNNAPEKASRPFDAKRDSGIISEGAGIVILENLETAIARGNRPYLEIKGYASNMDTDSSQPASGLAGAMEMALANAAKTYLDIDYISAWGPSHPILDRVETEMIKKIFHKKAYSIPVSSIKGVIGNPLAAAGAIQLISCALAIRNKEIPPTANYEFPDEYCDLDYVPVKSRKINIRSALVNAHGIGGGNSSLIVESFES